MFDMGNSSTANRRSYFKMSNLLKQQWVRASFAARMRGIKQPIPPVPQAVRLEFGRFLVVVLNSIHWFPWLLGNTIRFWMFLDFVASWERGRSQSTNWNRKLQQGIKWRIKAKACTSTAVCDLVMFTTWFVISFILFLHVGYVPAVRGLTNPAILGHCLFPLRWCNGSCLRCHAQRPEEPLMTCAIGQATQVLPRVPSYSTSKTR